MIMFQLSNFVPLVLESWSWWWDGVTENNTTRVILALLTVSLSVSWYAWLIKKSWRNAPPSPPGPWGLPLLGRPTFIGTDLARYLAKLCETYGPIVKFRMGRQSCIVIGSSSLAREMLRDKDLIFAQHFETVAISIISYFGHDIAFCPNYVEWQMLRKIFVREMMSSKAFEAFQQLRGEEVFVMVKEVCAKLGSPIDIYHLISTTMVNLNMNQLWGAVHGEGRIRLGVLIKHQIEEIMRLLSELNISDQFPILARFDLQGVASRSNDCMIKLDRIFDPLIERRKKGENEDKKNKGRKDFLQVLLEMKQGEDDDKPLLSMEQIKGIFIDIFTGSIDTTSTMAMRTMTTLLIHPQIMRKACQELDQVVGNDKMVEEFHLPKLHYLAAIIKETFRLYPADPLLIPQTPSETCTVSGYTIPKGSMVFFNVWAIQRDFKAWENPLEFQPERFLKDPAKGDYHGNNFNFFPFGSGRRICSGITLAERMLLYIMGSLLHSFEWKLADQTKLDLEECIELVMNKTNPLFAVPTAKLFTVDHMKSIDS